MTINFELSCNDCDDETIVQMFEKSGKVFIYRWYQCSHCGSTDFHSKLPKRFNWLKRLGL
jgi:hypothetical protein